MEWPDFLFLGIVLIGQGERKVVIDDMADFLARVAPTRAHDLDADDMSVLVEISRDTRFEVPAVGRPLRARLDIEHVDVWIKGDAHGLVVSALLPR